MRVAIIILVLVVGLFFTMELTAGIIPLRYHYIIQSSKYRNHAKWIEAMAKLESGNYTSAIFKSYNNMFGMGYPTIRATTALSSSALKHDGGRNMAVYESPSDSIRDLLLWFDYVGFPTEKLSLKDFAGLLQGGNGKGLRYNELSGDQYFNLLNSVL